MTEPDDAPDTWPEWVDKLGQTYRPGDFVAYASINGRSPQMVFARVLEIRRRDSKGALITVDVRYKTGNRIERPNGGGMMDEWRVRKDPYCKVKVQPIEDARSFYRSADAKAVTLSIPENIIRIEPRPEWTDEHITADLAALHAELG